MAFWEAVVLIVFICVVGGSISGRNKARGRRGQAEDEKQRADAETRIAKLEDRVKVLERIVTDRSTRLKEEIDAL